MQTNNNYIPTDSFNMIVKLMVLPSYKLKIYIIDEYISCDNLDRNENTLVLLCLYMNLILNFSTKQIKYLINFITSNNFY